MTSAPLRLVTVDIDGTLTLEHGWQPIAEAFGRRSEFDEAMARRSARTIGEDDLIRSLLGLAVGHTTREVQSLVAATPKLSGIPEGVARLHSAGLRVALLTHNPPYITRWYRGFGGFDGSAGLSGRQVERPRIGAPDGVRTDKLGGLAALTARWRVPYDGVLHAGDSSADVPVFRAVGRSLAVNAEDEAVRRAADRSIRTRHFEELADAVLSLAGLG